MGYSEYKKRKREEEKSGEKSNQTSSRSYSSFSQYKDAQKFGIDTFESDLSNLGTNISNIYSEWQTEETMLNTRKAVKSMQKRLGDYQSYQAKYGGADLSDLASGYQSVLDDWGNLSSTYGRYPNADAFNTAKKRIQMADSFRIENKDGSYRGLTYDEVQEKKKQYAEDSDEYKFLNEYTGFTDLRDFDKAIEAEKNSKVAKEPIKKNPNFVSNQKKYVVNPLMEQAVSNTMYTSATDKAYLEDLEKARNVFSLDNAFDSYKDLMNAEDFDETSQYVSTKVDGKWKQMTSQYGLGYGDLTYEYINDVDGMRSKIASKANAYGADSGDGVSPMSKKNYDQLKPEEIQVYNTLYAEDKANGTNKADKFLEDMQKTLDKRAYDIQTSNLETIADSGFLPSVGLSALSVPASLVGGVTGGIEMVGDALMGKDYNPYSYYKNPTNFAYDSREYVGENIAEETPNMELFGQNIPSLLYGVGMSRADSLVGGALFKGNAMSAILGSSAAQQRAKELTEQGASQEEIMRGAMVAGGAEFLGEKFGYSELMKAKDADSVWKIFTAGLKQAGSEALEEPATEVLNILGDIWNRGEDSDFKQTMADYKERGYNDKESFWNTLIDFGGDVAWAGVGGALSGGVAGSVKGASDYSTNKNVGKQIRANDRVGEMADLFDTMEMQGLAPEQSDAYKLYGEYLKNKDIENLSNAKLGNLYQTSYREALYEANTDKTTEAQKTDANKRLGKLAEVATSKPIDERARQKRVEELNKGEVTEVTATGNSAKVEGIRIEDGSTIVLTSEGEINAEDMTFSSNDAEILSYAEIMGAEKGNLFISQYDGKQDVSDYHKSFNLAYAYGEAGAGADSVLQNKGVLTEAQASAIYKNAVTAKANARQTAIDEITKKYSNLTVKKGVFDDSIIDYDGTSKDLSKVNWSTLTSKQREAVTFAKAFSKATGVNIRFIKSKVVNGEHKGKNGSYNPNTNTIEIDVYAGRIDAKSAVDAIIPTISHEVTHWMKAKSPKAFAKLQEKVMNTLALDDGMSMEDRVDEEMARIKRNHPKQNVTPEDAVDEIMARACEDMLSNSEKARELLDGLTETEKKSFLDKVSETFDNLIKWVNELLGKYKSESKEAEFLRGYGDALKEAQKMWDQAFAEAVKANQALQMEGKTAEKVINESLEKIGLHFDAETESVAPQNSERTWSESEYVQNRKKAIEQLSKALNISKEEAGKYIDGIDSVARMIADDRARLDYESNVDENATVVKPNSEYKWSVDMSTLCAKRLYFTGTFDEVQKQLPNTAMDSDDIVRLRAMMMERGYEVACGICYVESTRREIGTITADFIERYKLAQKTGKPIARLNSAGKEVELQEKGTKAKFYAEKGYTPTLADLNTTDIDLVKRDHPTVYAAYLSYMNARGQAKPKLLETRAEYKGEILSHFKAKSAVQSRNDAGGLRLQSFSDFEVPHLIDMMQVTMDMSRVGLKSQAYTKVVNFAEAFGDTGIKINLSLIAKGDGLDADGNLIFDDVEGIDHNEAFRLRDKYSKNVGTILVGKNDAHIIKAMADSRIDYIIPFHKSSWKESLYDALGLTGYDDYTEYQNEKPIDKSRKIKNFDPSEYWDFSKSGDENAQIYLEKCKADGRIPKFPQFAQYEGYWKLLIDFKMYDNNGVGSPQMPVTPNFNMDECNRILNEYKGGHRSFPVAKDVVKDFVAEYKQNHPQEQYSDRVYEYDQAEDNDLAEFVGSVADGNAREKDYRVISNHISDRLAVEIQKIVGLNVRGYGNEIDKGQVEHILKEHGEHGRSDNSMADVGDIARIGYAIENFDKIREGNNRSKYKNADGTKAKTVELQTRIGNNFYYVVEAVPDAKVKKLKVVSAYINKKDTFSEVAVPNGPSRYVQDESQSYVFNNIIPDSAKNTTTSEKFSDRDSDGNRLTKAQIEFFKDSKVRDEDGNLRVVYHGSEADFTVFDRTKARANMDIQGSFFSPWDIDAGGYGGNVRSFYLNIKNPASESMGYKALNKFKGQNGAGIKAREYLESLGYDGVNNGDEEYIAFYPEQIKLITNTNPTDSDDVRYSDRTMTRSEANQLARQRVASYKEQMEKKAKIESITQKALVLNRWMLKNSKDEHVPEAMKPLVAHLLKAIDFSSKQLLGMRCGQRKGQPTRTDISLSQALADIQQIMSKGEVDGEVLYELYGADLDADMADLVKSVNLYMRTVGDNEYVLNQMTLDELHKFDKIVGAIKASVTNMNQFHVANTRKSIAYTAQQDILSMNELGQAKLHKSQFMKGVSQMINWGNINPYFAFKRFGEGGKKIFEALQDGWDKFAFNVKKIIDYAEETYSSEDVKAWSEEVHEFDVLLPATKAELADPKFKGNHQRIQMTTAQIMSLYCLQKREQAKGHISGGGIRITDIETNNGIVSQSEGVVLTEKELNKIIGTLTKEQIAVADKLQKFMNEDCSEWGNEISMKRFGYKAFGEPNYFPIRSDENITNDGEVKEKEKSLYRLLNMSFTKALTDKANNRIVVDNIFDVFAQHTSEMAKYNALALPVLDAVRWFNYKEKGKKVDTHFKTYSVKQAMEKAFGKDAKHYVNTFLEDINGADNVGRDSLAKGFFANAKIAAVGFNIKTAALQPTSYLRASAIIDPKYLVKASDPTKVKRGIEMAEKWCGMALWKSLGFYDTNIQRGVAELIKHDKTWKDKVTEASMKGAEKMDKITWGCLWNACEEEVKATRKDLAVGTDEYYTTVGKRLREVIYATQVVDSTMTRSHMMRSPDKWDKVLTNFASEPTLAYNMLMDVFYDWKMTERKTNKSEAFKQHKDKMARVALAYTATNLVTSLLETAFQAYRDDDDEEEDLKEYVISFLESFGSNMGISTKIPYVKDLISILQGFTSSRTDTQWMQNLTYAFKDWMKIFSGKGNVYKAVHRTMSTASQLSGIALGNAMRDLASFWNLTIGNIFPSLKLYK